MRRTYIIPTASSVPLRVEAALLAGSITHETTHPEIGDDADYTRQQGVNWDNWNED